MSGFVHEIEHAAPEFFIRLFYSGGKSKSYDGADKNPEQKCKHSYKRPGLRKASVRLFLVALDTTAFIRATTFARWATFVGAARAAIVTEIS